MKKLLAMLLAVLMLFCLAACGGGDGGSDSGSSGDSGGSSSASYSAENPLVLKYSSHGSVTSDTGVYLAGIFEQIKEATEGRVVIEQYGSGILGSADELLSLLDTGVADLGVVSPAAFPTQFPCGNLVSLPMLPGFTSVMQANNALWDTYEKYPEAFDKYFEGYHCWLMYCGSMGCIGMDGPVESVADLKNASIRTFNDLTTIWLQKMGANPVAIGSADVYSSVEKGVVDGYMFDLGGIDGWMLYDVTEVTYDGGLFTVPGHIFFSEASWNKLTPEDQEILSSFGGREGSLGYTRMMNADGEQAVEQLGDSLVTLQPGDQLYDELADIGAEVTAEWIAERESEGLPMQEIYDYFVECLGKYE